MGNQITYKLPKNYLFLVAINPSEQAASSLFLYNNYQNYLFPKLVLKFLRELYAYRVNYCFNQEPHQVMYPKIAKFMVWSIALACGVSGVFLMIPVFYSNVEIPSVIPMVFILLFFPLRVASQYVLNPVGKVVEELQFQDEAVLKSRIKPLLNGIDINIRVGSYESSTLNAFAISSVFGKESLIAFSKTLLSEMSHKQFMAIAAHEVAHIKNFDGVNKSYILAFHEIINFYPRLISMMARELLKGLAPAFFLLFLVLFFFGSKNHSTEGLAAFLIDAYPLLEQIMMVFLFVIVPVALDKLTKIMFFHYSREREYAADLDGAGMTSKSDMKDALCMLSHSPDSKSGLFDTHPPLSERLARL